MMTVAKKTFTSIILFTICMNVMAENSDGITKQQQRIIDLSYNKMVLAFDALDNKIEQCHLSSYNNVLSAKLFSSLDLPLEAWKIILPYFRSRANHRCQGEAIWGNAIIGLNRFRLAEKHYTGKNISKTRYQQGNLCCARWESELALELKYLTLPIETRNKLTAIDKLQRPFDAMKAINDLESWLQ